LPNIEDNIVFIFCTIKDHSSLPDILFGAETIHEPKFTCRLIMHLKSQGDLHAIEKARKTVSSRGNPNQQKEKADPKKEHVSKRD